MTSTQFLQKHEVMTLIASVEMPAEVREALTAQLEALQPTTARQIFVGVQRDYLLEDITCLIDERFAEDFDTDADTICKEIDMQLIADRIEKHQECDWDTMEYCLQDYFAENAGKFSFNKEA